MLAQRLTTPARASLRERVAALTREHAAWWLATPAAPPAPGRVTSWWDRCSNARAARKLVDALAAEVAAVPDGAAERRAWQQSVRARLQDFGNRRLGWPAAYRRLLFAEELFSVATTFARAARRFDITLAAGDLFQALRNVWIGNSLQIVLGRPVALRPGLFAYSMLYPLTDNLLDDPRTTRGAKRDFNARLGERLAGRPVRPGDLREAAVFSLVGKVEEEYPRRRFADVHESLLAIHRGQVRSLSQQAGPALGDDELLAISCEKGGTSVLADLYLVAGIAGAEEERFAFGYGVFLQLLDDLQDVELDLAAGHQTLFTNAAARGPLDDLAARLLRYVDDVLDATPLLSGGAAADCKNLIRRNCVSLLVGAVAEQPSRFSRRFRRELTRRWPLSMRSLRRLRRRADGRFRAAAESLERRCGAPSLLDWALVEAE